MSNQMQDDYNGPTTITIDDLNISFKDNVITLELINGHNTVEYAMSLTEISHMPLYNEGVNHINGELPNQICAAIERAFRECKSMVTRGHK